MVGLITEQNLVQAEEEFPGISHFFEACACKPRTFLELVARFEHWCDDAPASSPCPAGCAGDRDERAYPHAA